MKRIATIIAGLGVVLVVAIAALAASRGFISAEAAPANTSVSTANSVSAGTNAVQSPEDFFAWALSEPSDNAGVAFAFAGSTIDFAAPGGPGDMQQRCEDFMKTFAKNLGVTTDQIQAAFKKTLLQQIDEAEKAGKLTADQAKAARDRINNQTTAFCAGIGAPSIVPPGRPAGTPGTNPGRPGGQGGPNGPIAPGQLMAFSDNMFKAAANHFGISVDQLKQDLKDKSSLKGVAAKYGKDTDAGKAALEAALEKVLRDELTQRGLSQDQITRMADLFKQSFDRLYTAPLGHDGQGGPGGPGRPGNGPNDPRGPKPSASPKPTN